MKLFGLKFLILLLVLTEVGMAQEKNILYKSGSYTLYRDHVVQGKFTATALSATQLESDYESPSNGLKKPVIDFKFSINGKDNEMKTGVDHHFNCTSKNGVCETPLIKFGQQFKDASPLPEGSVLVPGTKLKIRLDMRDVLASFKTKGYYQCFNGDKIYKQDFKEVYVAGSVLPLIWDFDNLIKHPDLQLKDPDGDGIYEVILKLDREKDQKQIASSWKLSKDVSAFPKYQSGYLLPDALYNLAMEEMQKAVEPDSTFRTGKEWSGVWTRDISYSIILSMAVLQPKVAMNSLMKKVKNNRVIQDTGTGGAYPASSDRMIWAVAAWEVYKVTGDHEWLTKAYEIVKNSVEDDLKNVYDDKTGLVRGESSFLDWREQTYPKWMQPADIYESECLGTNAVHFQVNTVLSEMAASLNDKQAEEKYSKIAAQIKKGIQTYLWQPEKKYYGQYLYGRNYKILSPRSEALGEALTVVFNIADPATQKNIVQNTPVNKFGIPCIYPQIPDIPPYHNNAVWPFVQSFWAMAAAKAGNEKSLVQSISAVYRPAAMFLTNKENFVNYNGDFAGTQINSSNMLWSLSGNISLVYKILFGISYNVNSLELKPFVPEVYAGKRTLTDFKYRKSMLDIEMEGFGNKIQEIRMDGKLLSKAVVPADLEGKHSITIKLANNKLQPEKVNESPDYTSPETPEVKLVAGKLTWAKVARAVKYSVLKNGKEICKTTGLSFPVLEKTYGEYQVMAIDANGVGSFASGIVQVIPESFVQIIQAESVAEKANLPYKGFSGTGFINISKKENISFTINIPVKEAGLYTVDFRYSNGNGPVNTENKCAIRTLMHNDTFLGTVVFPQRGKEEWSDWGFSNAVKIKLDKGSFPLSLAFKPANENMNGEVNQAMIDYVRIIKIGE